MGHIKVIDLPLKSCTLEQKRTTKISGRTQQPACPFPNSVKNLDSWA